MDDLTAKMLERVRGLLALAEDDGATPEEAELATARAAEIMAKYSIDKAMLDATADKREVPCDRVITFPQPYSKQHVWFYYAILRAFRGDGVIIQKPTRNRGINYDAYKVQVYAFEADLMVVDILYTSLLLQAANQLKNPPPYEHAKTWKVSFWEGFTDVVSERLVEANKIAEAEVKTPGTELVLRDRALEVQARKELDFPQVRKIAGPKARSEEGYRAGQKAGREANLHRTSNVGSTRRAALV